jgi:hypothetical protein
MADKEAEMTKKDIKKDKKGPQHDWVETSNDEKVEVREEKRSDGQTIRVRTRTKTTTYKEDTGEVTHHCPCVVS